MTVPELRPAQLAGLWYQSDPEALRSQVDQYIQQAEIPPLDGDVIAIIVPHAGHRFSGRTAGHAFQAVKGEERELVAVVTPIHSYTQKPLLTSAHEGYSTPLGPVWIDQNSLKALDKNLQQNNQFGLSALAYDEEHSLEIELPFLQQALHRSFKLIPIMVRSHSPTLLKQLGASLAHVLEDKSALLVASTDLSHFYPEQTAKQLDYEMLNQIENFSPEGVLQTEQEGKGFACGAGPVAAVLWAAKALGADEVKVLHHSTSGDETGDTSSVVGYGAAVILRHS